MPTEIVGQNGAIIKQNTKIGANGCRKSISRAQKLAAALKACKKKKNRHRRIACERQARRKFAAKQASKNRHTKHPKRRA
jgi:hypothetical protein